MSEAAIRAKIVEVLEGVADIGPVNNRFRFRRTLSKLLNLFRSTPRGPVCGHQVRREATSAQAKNDPVVDRFHHFRIISLYELDDEAASEIAFQLLIENMVAALLANHTLDGTCVSTEPLQVEEIDEVEFKDKPYHRASCLLVAHDRMEYP